MTLTLRAARNRTRCYRNALNVHVDGRHGGRVLGDCDRCVYLARLAYGVDVARRPVTGLVDTGTVHGPSTWDRAPVAGACDGCGEACTVLTRSGRHVYCGTCL